MSVLSNFNNKFYATNQADFKVKFDHSKRLKDQVIFAENNFYLLNVSKTYVNNNYIGVTLFYVKDTARVQKSFRDIKIFPEELVDDKDKFLLNKQT